MEKFSFETNEESQQLCLEIAQCMVNMFHIDSKEAIGRINKKWSRHDFLDDNDIRYHETPEDWAYIIYYGHDSRWWERKGDPNLKPLPFP